MAEAELFVREEGAVALTDIDTAAGEGLAQRPRPNEILVVMVIADGGRLQNRCGTEPIR